MQTLFRLQRSLEAAPWNRAILAEWQERFGQDLALLKPHLKPTGERAGVFPCPNGGGDACPRQVHERDGGFVAVCGNVPAECEPIPLTKTELAVLALDRAAALGPVVARVRAEEESGHGTHGRAGEDDSRASVAGRPRARGAHRRAA